MKNQLLIFFFLLSSVFAMGQSIGAHIGAGGGFLGLHKNGGYILPLLPNVGVDYLHKRSKKTALKFGFSITGQLFYSEYINEFDPDLSYVDWNNYGIVTASYYYFPVKYIYTGIGLNAKVKYRSATYQPSYSSETITDHDTRRPFIAEAMLETGLQANIWRFTLRLGSFMEIPLNNREYINLGLNTGIFYNFGD